MYNYKLFYKLNRILTFAESQFQMFKPYIIIYNKTKHYQKF